MKNTVEIRKEEHLNFVFEDDHGSAFHKDVAVFVNLYYPDTISYYLPYIIESCKVSNVYIATSNDETFYELQQFINKENITNRCRLIKKENRGRDISALLITFEPYMMKYRYVCFIHDKNWTYDNRIIESRKKWALNYWSNLLSSDGYMEKIIGCFDENPSLGMLVSPETFEKDDSTFCKNYWYNNYQNTVALAKKLGVDCELNEKIMPAASSSAFWARSFCLKKLYAVKWTYSDFPAEPMPGDGTISHAIERLIGYLPQDCGMTIGTVQTRENNSDLKEKSQDALIRCFDALKSVVDVDTVAGVDSFINFRDRLREYAAVHQSLYLYGTGVFGTRYLKWIRALGYDIEGFIVSKKTDEDYMGYKIYGVETVKPDDSTGIIISVSHKYQLEIVSELEKIGYTDYLVIEQDNS